jgi:hypothetical protein
MNLSRGVKAVLGISLVARARRAVENAGDERNIRVLARQLGCSVVDARRLYLLSREVGYGAAFQEVFPKGRQPRPSPSLPAQDVEVRARRRRGDQRIHR